MIIKINHLMIMRFVTLEFISKIDDPFGDSEIAHPRHKSRDEVEKRWEKHVGRACQMDLGTMLSKTSFTNLSHLSQAKEKSKTLSVEHVFAYPNPVSHIRC